MMMRRAVLHNVRLNLHRYDFFVELAFRLRPQRIPMAAIRELIAIFALTEYLRCTSSAVNPMPI